MSRRYLNVGAVLILLASGPYSGAENLKIVDGSAQVVGDPKVSKTTARKSWNAACDKFKAEARELNHDSLISLSCEKPTCESEEGMYTCSSTAMFKVRVSGTSIAEDSREPSSGSSSDQIAIGTAVGTAAVLGLIWVNGYWSSGSGHRHWHSGYWGHSYYPHYHSRHSTHYRW